MKIQTILLLLSVSSPAFPMAQLAPAVQWQQTFGGSAGESGEFLTAIRQTSDGGYVLGGYSNSGLSGNKTAEPFGAYDYWVVKLDGSGNKQWDQSFGSSDSDLLWNLQPTTDGGYILGGQSTSAPSGNKTSTGYGSFDWWIIKLDASGGKLWERSLGGSANELEVYSVQQTTDGGYILGGLSDSPPSGNKTSPYFGATDYWLVKVDAAGNRQWDKSFGGDGNDGLMAVQQTTDGGYILAGYSNSGVSGNRTSAGFGKTDYWVVKVDSAGNKQWESTTGGTEGEFAFALQTTGDGGYLIGGFSTSGASGNKTSPAFGGLDGRDIWVVKLDSRGNKLWDKSFGGTGNDRLNALHATTGGGYILVGESASGASGNKTTESFGKTDGWLIKIDAVGNSQWEQAFGGVENDVLASVQEASDGSLVLGGYSNSGVSGNKTTDTFGAFDYWVIKLAAPLQFGSPAMRTNKVFHAPMFGLAGTTYVLQASTNLINWTSLLTNRSAESGVSFVDTNAASFPRRFYRITQEP